MNASWVTRNSYHQNNPQSLLPRARDQMESSGSHLLRWVVSEATLRQVKQTLCILRHTQHRVPDTTLKGTSQECWTQWRQTLAFQKQTIQGIKEQVKRHSKTPSRIWGTLCLTGLVPSGSQCCEKKGLGLKDPNSYLQNMDLDGILVCRNFL